MKENLPLEHHAFSLIRLIAEDGLYRVFLKPPGVFSSSKIAQDRSIATWIERNLSDQACVGNDRDCGLAHRLDEETSGVLVSARSDESWVHLRSLFSTDRVLKWYVALVEGQFPAPVTCAAAIASRYRHSAKVVALPDAAAGGTSSAHLFHSVQSALSHFFPLSTFEDSQTSLVAVLIKTGRRHQIRAHAASLGHPLAGDTLYGSTARPRLIKDRAFLLHSLGISFTGIDSIQRSWCSTASLPDEVVQATRSGWSAIAHDEAAWLQPLLNSTAESRTDES